MIALSVYITEVSTDVTYTVHIKGEFSKVQLRKFTAQC